MLVSYNSHSNNKLSPNDVQKYLQLCNDIQSSNNNKVIHSILNAMMEICKLLSMPNLIQGDMNKVFQFKLKDITQLVNNQKDDTPKQITHYNDDNLTPNEPSISNVNNGAKYKQTKLYRTVYKIDHNAAEHMLKNFSFWLSLANDNMSYDDIAQMAGQSIPVDDYI